MTAVMDLASAPIRLSSPAKVRAARHKVRNIAAPVIGPAAAGDVEVMVSEAITNALLHGRGGAAVTVSCQERALRVEVRDDGPGFEVARRLDHGRGLALVEALSARWGLEAAESGTCLWFEVDR